MARIRYTFLLRLWAVAALTAFLSGPAMSATRVALVIGNSAYANVPPLGNPRNDVADIGAALDRLGFEVTRLEDAGYATLRRGLQTFRRRASAAEIAVVFYAGHGIEVNKHNFLVPVDAQLRNDGDVEYEAVPLELVMRAVVRSVGIPTRGARCVQGQPVRSVDEAGGWLDAFDWPGSCQVRAHQRWNAARLFGEGGDGGA